MQLGFELSLYRLFCFLHLTSGATGNVSCIAQSLRVKAISTLSIRTRFSHSTKTYTIFILPFFFFLASGLHALEGSMF